MQLYGRGLRRRLPTMLDGDPRRIRMVYSLLFSLPGTPVLFYGEEIGMGENLEIDGRMAVRTPMQWSAERHDGFPTADAKPSGRSADGPRPTSTSRDQRRDPRLPAELDGALIRRRRGVPGARLGDDARCSTPAGLGPRPPLPLGGGTTSSPSTTSAHGACVPRSWSRTRARTPCSSTCSTTTSGGWATRGRVKLELPRYGARWYRLRRAGQRIAP